MVPGQSGATWAKVRLVAGTSGGGEWRVDQTIPQARIAVGSAAPSGWIVTGAGVQPVHLELYWDGRAIYVADAARTGSVHLDGVAVGSWTPIPGRGRVTFGSGAFEVETSAAPPARPAQDPATAPRIPLPPSRPAPPGASRPPPPPPPGASQRPPPPPATSSTVPPQVSAPRPVLGGNAAAAALAAPRPPSAPAVGAPASAPATASPAAPATAAAPTGSPSNAPPAGAASHALFAPPPEAPKQESKLKLPKTTIVLLVLAIPASVVALWPAPPPPPEPVEAILTRATNYLSENPPPRTTPLGELTSGYRVLTTVEYLDGGVRTPESAAANLLREGRLEEAYLQYRELQQIEPGNQAIIQMVDTLRDQLEHQCIAGRRPDNQPCSATAPR